MKSIPEKFNEALEALDKVGKRQKFEEKNKPGSPIEVQLNCAEAVLRESRTFRKHNGGADNFVDGSPFNGEHTLITESYVQETSNSNSGKGGDRLILEAMVERGEMTPEQKRVALGQPPAEYANLSESQKREYNFARSIGITEQDALKVAKITNSVRR